MIEHSPGPWEAQSNGHKWWSVVGRDVNGVKFYIATMEQTTETSRAEGDAKIMAAAPEMLEALKQALHHVRNIPAEYDQVAVPKAFAISAIANGLKAVGITNLGEID